ncbi:MAG: methyltransferase [Deltaproteobacteria bacterium]|nr:methyltransferase [Deltaproteobacteria bacterium]
MLTSPQNHKGQAPGIVRPARRPLGWAPGGPQPRGPQGRADLAPATGEDLCYLAGDFRIFQRQDGHRWSLDDLITAWFAATLLPAPPTRHLDLGCGIGSVLMMLAWRFPELQSEGIEAQSLSADLLRRSLAYNGLTDRVRLHEADFRTRATLGTFDLITGTPPYFDARAGVQSTKPQCAPCRFEHRGGVEDYVQAAAPCLAPGGLFVMVAATAQAPRVASATSQLGLQVLQQLDVIPREGKAALISLFACGTHATVLASTRHTAPTLTVRTRALAWTPEFKHVRQTLGMPVAAP